MNSRLDILLTTLDGKQRIAMSHVVLAKYDNAFKNNLMFFVGVAEPITNCFENLDASVKRLLARPSAPLKLFCLWCIQGISGGTALVRCVDAVGNRKLAFGKLFAETTRLSEYH